jgi:hypothetical protein
MNPYTHRKETTIDKQYIYVLWQHFRLKMDHMGHRQWWHQPGTDQYQQLRPWVVRINQAGSAKAATAAAIGRSSSPAGQVKERRRQSWIRSLANR